MNININVEGVITEIGIFQYNYPCPDFITFDNFTRMKCINIDDHMNHESWVEVPQEENS